MPMATSVGDWAIYLASAGITARDIHRLLDLESQLPALTEADVNGHLAAMLASEHHSTWFTVQGSGSRFQFRRGGPSG